MQFTTREKCYYTPVNFALGLFLMQYWLNLNWWSSLHWLLIQFAIINSRLRLHIASSVYNTSPRLTVGLISLYLTTHQLDCNFILWKFQTQLHYPWYMRTPKWILTSSIFLFFQYCFHTLFKPGFRPGLTPLTQTVHTHTNIFLIQLIQYLTQWLGLFVWLNRINPNSANRVLPNTVFDPFDS